MELVSLHNSAVHSADSAQRNAWRNLLTASVILCHSLHGILEFLYIFALLIGGFVYGGFCRLTAKAQFPNLKCNSERNVEGIVLSSKTQ